MNAPSPDNLDDQRLLRKFLRLSMQFWSGTTRRKAWLLTGGLFACLLINLGAAVAINRWNKYFFDALQNKDQSLILWSLVLVAMLALFSAAAGVAQLHVRMRLQLRWREWLTTTLVRRWLEKRRFYQISVLGLIDNPEARIAEDGHTAVALFVDFAAGVTNAILAAAAFVSVLWFVGGSINVAGVTIPGFMVIAAIVYSLLTSFGMLLLGRPLVARVEAKAGGEADFRYQLTHTRENAENIALVGGDDDERNKLQETFAALALRWVAVIGAQARMLFLSNGNNVLAPVVPLLLGAPKYLAGDMSLGDLMQAAAAFSQVQMALNWLADNSLRLADWFASARRVATLDRAFDRLDAAVAGPQHNSIDLGFSDDGALYLKGLSIAQHDGTLMLSDVDAKIERGQKILVKGDSGTGKSTLIRAMAGLWPWGSGSILRPRDATFAFMPQSPYIPIGTLRAALNYPLEGANPDDETIRAMLSQCGLEHLVAKLDVEDNWANILSGGERQRFAFARLALKKPDIVIMDEPTSALDEVSQSRMMTLVRDELPDSMVLHVAHRPGLERFHDRELTLSRNSGAPAEMSEERRDIWSRGGRLFERLRMRGGNTGADASKN